jgi:membrane dipeptidase
VIASHSSAFALAMHPRNVPDDVLERIAPNGGVIMVNFFSGFIDPEAVKRAEEWRKVYRELRSQTGDDADLRKKMSEWEKDHPIPRAKLSQVLDHIQHIARVAGIDHVGIGSDFDGINSAPVGLEDVSCFPHITQGLLDRGFTPEQIRKILGGNLLRAFAQAEVIARQLQTDRKPSLQLFPSR